MSVLQSSLKPLTGWQTVSPCHSTSFTTSTCLKWQSESSVVCSVPTIYQEILYSWKELYVQNITKFIKSHWIIFLFGGSCCGVMVLLTLAFLAEKSAITTILVRAVMIAKSSQFNGYSGRIKVRVSHIVGLISIKAAKVKPFRNWVITRIFFKKLYKIYGISKNLIFKTSRYPSFLLHYISDSSY